MKKMNLSSALNRRLNNKTCNRNLFRLTAVTLLSGSLLMFSCSKDDDDLSTTDNDDTTTEVKDTTKQVRNDKYTMEQTVSDEAQRNTIAFDALGFMTGNLGSQTFLPPGKVADYSGFQYLRDNDPTGLGHNTSFVTIIAFNILDILSESQIDMFIDAAKEQVDLVNEYAYKRFPLCKAFRRLLEDDIPTGTTGLDMDAVKDCSAKLYEIDGLISYNRAELFGKIVSSLTDDQKAELDALKDLNGVGNWPNDLQDPLKSYQLDRDVNVGVMTYASEIYAWYAGSVDADVYFCPERQGTYFGSFYLKDWPAMGNPNYSIDEQLTAQAGQNFFNILTESQYDSIAGLVNLQKPALTQLVEERREISIELRNFLSGGTADQSDVLSMSKVYGELDGEIIYYYATYFSGVYQSLSNSQKDELIKLADGLGYLDPTGAFLYSAPIEMPEIENTDYLFN